MSKSQNSFNKREKEKLKEKKRKEKEAKKLAKKEKQKKGNFEDMIAYVDKNGNIVSEQPDRKEKEEIDPITIEVSVPKKKNVPEEGKSGYVVYLNKDKGYGFIQDSITKKKVLVRINQIEDEIKVSDNVTFEVTSGTRGPIATNVRLKQASDK